ncbi:MerR family transcriptional regulator [Nocardia brasiliensis]|uniref:MerR family transcriptional regulator n=1 Tax=Nocardia brasiliensis TaxID=37326 RepID=UPI002454A8B0|nr:MerR family transcriptional regulator [Nocardia brasiliensis]
MAAKVEYTIDELARAADTTVRSVRVYHERGLLPSPEVRGRVGYYRSDHLNRLETISRLLSRGMKLSGIKELLEAWDRGDGLADVLGVTDPSHTEPAPAEPEAIPGPVIPDYATQARACHGDPLDAYRLTNPRCGDLAARLVAAGLGRRETFELVERLRSDCGRMVERYAAQVYQHLAVDAFVQSGRDPEDHTKLKTDLAIARLVVASAAAELIDQAFDEYAEQTAGDPTARLLPQT